MPYGKRISPTDVVTAALQMVEAADADGLSLRGVALSLGVKAPSLYRYFPSKGSLEFAVAEQALQVMAAELRAAALPTSTAERFHATTQAYLRFAREHFPLYTFIMRLVSEMDSSPVAKDVWNLLLEAASDVSEQRDDTAAAVALWSFLHGYVVLERSGAFGASGPKGGLDLGLAAFLASFRREPASLRPNKV